MIFICDIDGTIASLTLEQEKFVSLNKAEASERGLNWDDHYYSHCVRQEPIKKNLSLANNFIYCSSFWIVTSRSEKYRDVTLQWLLNDMPRVRNEKVLMRGEDDFRPSHIVKQENLHKIKKQSLNVPYNEIIICFEDNPDCIEMYRKEGCFVLEP